MLTRLHNVGLDIVGEYIGSSKKYTYKCLHCGNTWPGPKLINKILTCEKLNSNGCPQCKQNNNNEKNANKIIDKLKVINEKYDITLNGNKQLKLNEIGEFRFNKCGHIFTSTIGNLFKQGKTVCDQCIIESQKNTYEEYVKNVNELTKINYTQYKHIINPNNLPITQSTEGGYYLHHIVLPKYGFDNNIPYDLISHPQNIKLRKWGINKKYSIPPILLKYFNDDILTKTFIEMFDLFGIKYVTQCELFNPFNVTIYCPDIKYAFNLCLFDNYVEQKSIAKYDCKKITKIGQNNGITVIHVFQDEWVNNKTLVENKIKHLIGFNNSVNRIHARQCDIKLLNGEEKQFLKTHHIQGNGSANIKYGAFYKGELVAVMTFSYGRVLMGSVKEDDVYELARFATNTDYRIPGIASKLLKKFIIEHNPIKIFSYADARWSTGKVYEKLGFTKTTMQQSGYCYIINGVKYHRWGFRKDILKEKYADIYNPELTEYQNMLNIGHDKIWDCGTIKYEMVLR